jgi:hypothetical protein
MLLVTWALEQYSVDDKNNKIFASELVKLVTSIAIFFLYVLQKEVKVPGLSSYLEFDPEEY